MNLLKVDENSLNISEENSRQINKDLARTYPNLEYFKKESGQNKMLNVLKAFSIYYREICKILFNFFRLCTRNEFYSWFFSLSL